MSEKINIKTCKQRVSYKSYFIFGAILSLLLSMSSGGYVGYTSYISKDSRYKQDSPKYVNMILLGVSILFFIIFVIVIFFLIKDINGKKYSEYPCYLEESIEIMIDENTRIPFNDNYYVTDLPKQPVTTTTRPPDIQQELQQNNKTILNSTTNINANNVPGAIINSSNSQDVDNSASQIANRNTNVDIDETSLLLGDKNNSSNVNITTSGKSDEGGEGGEVSSEGRIGASASSNMVGDINFTKGTTIVV